MSEQDYDRLLNIHTSDEQMGFPKSFHYHRYEPTPYSALVELFKHYKFTDTDRIIDFGCGKGRLNFFLHHLFNVNVVGIEMDIEFYHEALRNLERYLEKNPKGKGKILFHHGMAQEYNIEPMDNRFYFFNPFSIQIFTKVINHILLSVESHYREIELILYYPSKDYTYFLDNQSPFQLKEEVPLGEDYDQNPFEKFMIYRFEY